MATRYVTVPASALHDLLTKKQFAPATRGHERVYTRQGKVNAGLAIIVYSSVTEGAGEARACGEDAIRVSLLARVGSGRDWTLHKCKRIHRTGSVEKILARVMERIMEAAEASKAYGTPCPKCAAPTYADSGRCLVRSCREGAR